MICEIKMSKIIIIGLLINCPTGIESKSEEEIKPGAPFNVSNCADNHPLWCKHRKSLCSRPSIASACRGTCGLCLNKCQDIFSKKKCTEYSEMGYCIFSKMIQWKCKKTCKRCRVDTCTDKDKACSAFVDECEEPIVQDLCRYTCDKCHKEEEVVENPKGRGCDCGLENVQRKLKKKPSGLRIVGGTDAGQHSLPWMVYIVNEKVPGSPRCGGSIINSRYILTAAHCTYESNCQTESKPSDFSVTIADHNVNSMNDDIRGVTEKVKVEKIIRHEKYCKTPKKHFDNDIVLFRLSKEINLLDNPEVGIICLPKSIKVDYSSSNVMVAGWGYVKRETRDNNIFATTLQIVNLKQLNCGDFPNQDQISDNMICAGDPGNQRDACAGDSGGPLTVRIDLGDGRFRHIQIGIVSFGASNICDGWGAYTKVQNYLDWIDSHIQDGGCDNVNDAGYQSMPDEGQPQTAGQPASRTAALGQPQIAGQPASRTAAMPGNPPGYPFPPYGAEDSAVADHPLCGEMSVEDCNGPKAARVKKNCPNMCAQKDSDKTEDSAVADHRLCKEFSVEDCDGHKAARVKKICPNMCAQKDSDKTECSSPWQNIPGIVGRCYFFSADLPDTPATIQKSARDTCTSYGGDLATAGRDSPDPLLQYYRDNNYLRAWVGASRSGTSFQWFDGRSLSVDSDLWQPDNPNYDGDCVEVLDNDDPKRGLLNDLSCTHTRHFICEKLQN